MNAARSRLLGHGAGLCAIPPYVDGLTHTFYGALCRALYLHQSCGTPTRAIELEVRFGTLSPRRGWSSAMPSVQALTPAVLRASHQNPYTFHSDAHSSAVGCLESSIKALGEAYAQQSHNRLDTCMPPPKMQTVVRDADKNIRLVYDRAVSDQIGKSPKGGTYILTAFQQKRTVDAFDVTCMEWLTDMRLAIACEDALSESLLSSPTQTEDTVLAPDPSSSSSSAQPPSLNATQMILRLRRTVQVHPYLHFHVTNSRPLAPHNARGPFPFVLGKQLTPSPPVWSSLSTNSVYRFELEVDLPAVYRDWVRLAGAKSTRAVLHRYVDDRTLRIDSPGDASGARTASRDRGADVVRGVVARPMDPFLRSVVEDLLAAAQFATAPSP